MLVLVRDAAESVPSSYIEMGELVWVDAWFGQRVQRPGIGNALVWPVLVEEVLELS